ncbi:MAG: LEA type 2 family protein [Elusimicrobiaceae bacterium]|jgi:LEA14-like dessication related protein|nr:LEA type 2 family protein [Elusimicrobiaceae bacterium]MBT3955139.1 LEA type 2 family protein [Elusimicrobiaceae bacterium]MBT4007968.1 LEA type 2 family protein [Elusimicrobiaceae bacterium]MBT4402651.1 LEA type 2 family protein [Elusimicrobiaceae bacterium]MBT4440324.1 LEA type 2 family protein [Elusimicrobiaceae bacterium]
MKKLIFLLPILILLIACSSTQITEDIAVRKCEYQLASVNVREHNTSDISLNVVMQVKNPNKDVDAKIRSFEGTLHANNRPISDINFENTLIPAKQTVPLAATITVTFEQLGKTLSGLIAMHSSEIKYHIEGIAIYDTSMGDVSIPVYTYEKRD